MCETFPWPSDEAALTASWSEQPELAVVVFFTLFLFGEQPGVSISAFVSSEKVLEEVDFWDTNNDLLLLFFFFVVVVFSPLMPNVVASSYGGKSTATSSKLSKML